MRPHLVRGGLAALFLVSGTLHLAVPRIYRGIMPPYLPHPDALILVSGLVELLGGIGLLVPITRRIAGVGLMLLLGAVFPANVQMLVTYRAHGAPWWAEGLLWARLPLQVVLMWWVWRSVTPRATTPANSN